MENALNRVFELLDEFLSKNPEIANLFAEKLESHIDKKILLRELKIIEDGGIGDNFNEMMMAINTALKDLIEEESSFIAKSMVANNYIQEMISLTSMLSKASYRKPKSYIIIDYREKKPYPKVLLDILQGPSGDNDGNDDNDNDDNDDESSNKNTDDK